MKSFSRVARIRMLLRSFAVQGSWNYKTLIGSGFGFTILPALREIHPADAELDQALTRHTELFNSHPYLVTVAAGAVARLESSQVDPVVINRFKTALRGSLGSLGDRLIWSTWRPMSALAGIALVFAGAGWWVAISSFLILYNVMHLTVRVMGMKIGLETGLDVGKQLKALPLQSVIDRASQVACLLAAFAVVVIGAPAFEIPLGAVAVCLSVFAGFFLGFRMRGAMTALVTIVVAIALILGMVGYGA